MRQLVSEDKSQLVLALDCGQFFPVEHNDKIPARKICRIRPVFAAADPCRAFVRTILQIKADPVFFQRILLIRQRSRQFFRQIAHKTVKSSGTPVVQRHQMIKIRQINIRQTAPVFVLFHRRSPFVNLGQKYNIRRHGMSKPKSQITGL
ncbi:MAG: hypothetical protein BHW58_00665 [Azospirillum sp. 51_20]|nr:MAG: hypothetical protein BHW58_00665 [Azospirillum sp. 51_20]